MARTAHPVWRAGLGLLLLIGGLLPIMIGADELAHEGQLKAAYLVNFLKYIDWPAHRPTANLCLFGRDSLGIYLDPYDGRLVQGRTLHVRRVSVPEQLGDCDLLFVPETEDLRFAAILRWTGGAPILTVSDHAAFAREGGGISLVSGEGRLQFEINLDALNRAGLKPASQLMRLARQIHGSHRLLP